jgi:RNA polymerase sigma-B factor
MAIDNNARMSDSEIHELLRVFQETHNGDIRDRIVMQYTNLVESVARRFAGAAEPMEDLAQEGYIGLLTAIDGYNVDKGVKFSTYATHFIIGQIKHHLRDRGKIIKEPAWLQELNQRVTRVIESLCQETGRMPSNAEIAEVMGMTEEAISDMLTSREIFKVASLDGNNDQDEEAPATYDMERVKPDHAVEFQLPIEEKVVLEEALQKLKSLEQRVIQEFYFRDRSQTEIARNFGISCNYVSHILRNSTRKLKKILVTDELKEAQLALTYLKKRLEEQAVVIQEQTVVDSTTRLYNRSYFESRLSEEVSRASRHQYPLAVLIIVLDGYPAISRQYGIIRAEETIRRCANLIREGVRRVDIVTYFGEGVFGLILPHTGQQVDVVADRMQQTLLKWIKGTEKERSRTPMNLMMGAACYPGDSMDLSELVTMARQNVRPTYLLDELAIAA